MSKGQSQFEGKTMLRGEEKKYGVRPYPKADYLTSPLA
jgi:hypothetical protein